MWKHCISFFLIQGNLQRLGFVARFAKSIVMVPAGYGGVSEFPFLKFAVAVLGVYFVAVLIRGASRKLPPGPVGFPIIGSVHLLGPRSHVSLAQLARKYGAPLMSLYLGQKLFVVASSAEAAMEVLKKQDAVFCSRPPLRGFKVIFPHDVTFADLTPESNYLRKFIRLHLTTARSIEAFQHIRVDEMLQMVRSIVASPRDVVVNLRTSLEVMTANVLTRSIIGKRFMGRTGLSESEKKEIMEFIHIAAEIGECLGAKNPGDLIPALKLVDWNGLDQRMKNLRRKMATFLANIVRERREKSSLGTSNPPGKEMLGVLLDEMENAAAGEKITEDILNTIIWESFTAGMETTVLATDWTLAEVLRNPEVLQKCQAELDAVVGRNRRAQESDIPDLHYIKAVVKESFRLHPVIPLLIPHYSHDPIKVLGYDIPAHTQLLINVWAIGRDPKVWADPLKFHPERFLEGPHRETEMFGKSFNLLPFGSGRRACMGITLGTLLVEASVVVLLHSFDWILPAEGIDMTEGQGLSVRKNVPACAFATPRLPPHVYAE
nr:hypothetical protein PHYPA_009167 [Physcomitrium patens]